MKPTRYPFIRSPSKHLSTVRDKYASKKRTLLLSVISRSQEKAGNRAPSEVTRRAGPQARVASSNTTFLSIRDSETTEELQIGAEQPAAAQVMTGSWGDGGEMREGFWGLL